MRAPRCWSLPALLTLALAPVLLAGEAQSAPDGTLSPQLLDDLRSGYEMNAADRAIYNAVTNTDVKQLSLNRDIVRGHNGHFSHKINFKGVTNQKSSGRCWMFAGLNTMRPRVIKSKGLQSFEFSAAYLQFWDKLEKSNNYLETMIELRKADHLDREWELVHEWALSDGGWWNYVTGLIDKYGVVPVEAMPETHSSSNTREMNRVLERLLRARAAKLHQLAQDGVEVAALREIKRQVLAEVYRLLVLNLGEPPRQFVYRAKVKSSKEDKDGKDDSDDQEDSTTLQSLSPAKTYTPQQFYRELVGVKLADYVCLYNDPNQKYGRHYRFHRARNIYGAAEMHFINVTTDTLKSIAQASIVDNEPVWFAADVGRDQSSKLGIMADRLYDYSTLFNLDLKMTKAERIRYRLGGSNHAMVLMGVDVQADRPVKWLVENSWGADKGDRGTWTIYDRWFDEHVYTVIAHKRHVPADVLKVFDEAPTVLPIWYPGALGVK